MLLFNKQLHTGDKITIQNTKYKIQNTNMQIWKYANMQNMQNTKYKIQNTKYKIQNTKYKIQNTKYKTNTIALSRGCQINDEHCIYVVDVL